MNGNQSTSAASYVLQEQMEADDSHLDPRIYKELEKLNKASEEINCLEVELDNARAHFRQVLNESISQLNSLSRRLGGCVDKARPYYDARKKALEAQLCTQNAAIKFEKACSQLAAAKEMVNLAEQGYFKMGQCFDPAWQEMLNHSTIRVNDAEKERLECEVAHRMTTFIFNEAEQTVRRLQKEYKRSISKSKPYFELKAKYNQMMEDQKKKVERLEASVSKAKDIYSETLRSLETISDEIHRKRGTQRKYRRIKARPKRPNQIYHPLMDASEVIVEEVSSPSPEEKLITQLDALHHIQKDIDSSQANKTANHSNKETKIAKKENSNCDIVLPNENKMPDATGDATDSPKPLYRSLDKSIEKTSDKSFSEEIQIVTLLASNKLPPSTKIVSADAKTVPTDTKIVPTYTKSEPPKFKNLKFLSDESWNELLSPIKQMSSSETLFHAPLNPVKVENLSTERVDQKLFTRGQTFTVHELMQKTLEDKSDTLKSKDSNRDEIKASDKVHAKEVTDENYMFIKKRSKNRRKTEDSGVQSSSRCQDKSLIDDQKYLSSPEHDKNLHPLSISPDLLRLPGSFKDASHDSSPEKQDALQQTSYTFLTDKREASLQTSYSLFDRKDELQQTSCQAFHVKNNFHPRRVSWGKSVDIEINNSDNSRKYCQITGHHHHHHHHLELKVKDDQVWKPPHHHCQVVSKTSPTSSQFLHGKLEQSQAEVNSETESIASSLNSTSLLDDEQVESLMMETGQYHSFLSQMDAQESECFRRLTLPNKLRYLKNLVNFDPVWLDGYDDNDDDEIGNKNEARAYHPSPSDEEKFTQDEDGEELGDDDDHDNEYFEECCSASEYECGTNRSNDNVVQDQYIDQFDSMLTNLKRVTFDDVERHHSICDDMESTESDSRTLNSNYRTTPRMANRNKN